MREERQAVIMALSREQHPAFLSFEEREDQMRAQFADDPEGFELHMQIKEHLLTVIPVIPAAQCQICDIQHAIFHPSPRVPCSLHRCIWSALPQDLTELVLSKLPMKHIIALTRSTGSFLSACFRRSAAQRHPDLLALMRWIPGTMRATVYDPSCNAWTGFNFTGFPASSENHRDPGYEDSMYAHDRGLVCFVPPSHKPVLVTNPLTGEWRTLPFLEHKQTLAVQILVEDSGVYKVKLVCGDTDVKKLDSCRIHTPENSAFCYDSGIGRWETLETGFVFAGCGSLQQFQRKVPVVFDCAKKLFWYLTNQVSEQQPYNWAGARDSVAILHDACGVTELAWRGKSYSMQRTMTLGPYVYRSKAPHLVFQFATERFLFVVGDSNVKVHGKSCQLLQVFDRETRKWRLASDLGESDSHPQCLKRAFVCELRWDAVP